MAIRITPLAQSRRNPLVPDIVWDGRVGDYLPVGATEPGNPYGLRSRQILATAVLICLQTDRAVEPEELREGDEQKGWPGDAFDIDTNNHEGPLGSRLWQLRRRALDAVETPRFAEHAAREALQPLIDQDAVARWDISAEARLEDNYLNLDIAGYDRDGVQVYDQIWRLLWDQLHGVDNPLAR